MTSSLSSCHRSGRNRGLVSVSFISVAVFIVLLSTCTSNSRAEDEQQQDVNNLEWWKKTNFYHIYIRSFKDSDGDGNGDLRGVIEKLDYLKQIGVETVLMGPFYSSPMRDGGYDISDYFDVHPRFGTMRDFEELVAGVKERDMKILVDFVPNHSSNKNVWFNCSEYALEDPERCGKYKDWYVWTDSKRYEGKYPSNWISVFGGGPAWTWSPVRKQFYLHQFLPEQPDFNLRNPAVREQLKEIIRFWLRKGADGIRADSVIYLLEDENFTDEPEDPNWQPGMDPADRLLHIHTRSVDGTPQIMKDWQDVMNEPEFRSSGPKVVITEAYDTIPKLLEHYGPNPQTPYANMPFNFELMKLRERTMEPQQIEFYILSWINGTLDMRWPDEHGAISPWNCWVGANHDNPRRTNLLGYHNAAVYIWIRYLLPGVPVNYYGEEMGMLDLPYNDIPERTIAEGESSRLPERGPMAWTSEEPSGGFSNSSSIWLPLERDWRTKNVASFMAATHQNNFLQMFLKLQRLRQENLSLFVFGDLVFFRNHPTARSPVLAMARTHEKFGNLLLLVNLDYNYSGRAEADKRAIIHLEANESIIKKRHTEPPKRGTIVLTNLEPGHESAELRDGAEVDLENLALDQAVALLIKY